MLPIHKFIAESLSQFLLDSLLHRFGIFLSGLKIVETFYAQHFSLNCSLICLFRAEFLLVLSCF